LLTTSTDGRLLVRRYGDGAVESSWLVPHAIRCGPPTRARRRPRHSSSPPRGSMIAIPAKSSPVACSAAGLERAPRPPPPRGAERDL